MRELIESEIMGSWFYTKCVENGMEVPDVRKMTNEDLLAYFVKCICG